MKKPQPSNNHKKHIYGEKTLRRVVTKMARVIKSISKDKVSQDKISKEYSRKGG